VWQRAHALALEVYRLPGGFPSDEKFGLVSQMRRAAVSVPANIAEGFKKRGSKDKANFYNIAQGSLEELRYYYILSRDLGYLKSPPAEPDAFEVIGRMLHSLIRVPIARRSWPYLPPPPSHLLSATLYLPPSVCHLLPPSF
jgi:four helix bundle protein